MRTATFFKAHFRCSAGKAGTSTITIWPTLSSLRRRGWAWLMTHHRCRDGRAMQAVGRVDHVGAALGDHHDAGVAVARRHRGHHARVGDTEALDPVHAQLRVDDGELMRQDPARW